MIEAEMTRQNISQSQMARDLRYSVSTINNIVTGRRGGNTDTLGDILNYLQIELGYRSKGKEA